MTTLTAGLENEKEVDYDKNEFEPTDTHMNSIKNDLREMLSIVTDKLSENGRLEEWVSIFYLIKNYELDLDNIAVQLFWDAVKFHKSW